MYHHTIKDLKTKSLAPGVDIQALTGEKMSMVFFYIGAGATVPEHSHPHEQMGTILKGSLELTIGEETKVVKQGDVWSIPPDVVHKGKGLDEPAEVLEFFSPVREDYT